ncbi:MAG: hypothetical protein K6G04_08180 [Lachnospiraceae bacterium]|nr:hypothetical protein [Lachnospiraceae bacterium]
MLTYAKVFNLDKEKNANKVYRALDQGSGKEYLNAFMSEAQKPGVMDLCRAQLMITENYVCYYGRFRQEIYIIPLADLVNVYTSNCFYGNYNYTCKAIALETRNNETFYVSQCMQKQNVADYNTAQEYLIKRCASNESSLIA